MTPIRWTWAVLALIYLSFFSWYTSFAGPLTAEEIEHYMSLLAAADADPEQSGLAAQLHGIRHRR